MDIQSIAGPGYVDRLWRRQATTFALTQWRWLMSSLWRWKMMHVLLAVEVEDVRRTPLGFRWPRPLSVSSSFSIYPQHSSTWNTSSSSTRERLLVYRATVQVRTQSCSTWSTISTQLGPEILNSHVISQQSTGILWLVPRVCVCLQLLTLSAYCAMFSNRSEKL